MSIEAARLMTHGQVDELRSDVSCNLDDAFLRAKGAKERDAGSTILGSRVVKVVVITSFRITFPSLPISRSSYT
jgi:hypothetical protein